MDPMQMLTKSRMILESSSGGDSASNEKDDSRPSPTNFIEFLPWACCKMNVDAVLDISKVSQTEYINVSDSKVKAKSKQVKKPFTSELAKAVSSSSEVSSENLDEGHVVRMAVIYSKDILVHLKIDKTKYIPREVFAILNIIIKFYPHLSAITINSGADKYTIHELCKFLPRSNITEINLDNTFIKEANYDAILDNIKQLKVLSLSRCKLGDYVVKKIASKLEYPMQAAATLAVLNLSSNRITDKAAKALGQMLRTNRCLSYLNIAGNMITDDGIEAILNVLYRFPLTVEEMLIVRGKYLKYLKKRQDLIDQYLVKLREEEIEKRRKPKRGTKSGPDIFGKSLSVPDLSSQLQASLYEKALNMAKEICGKFEDPLSQYSVNLLLKVLTHQRSQIRSPRGLVNVSLEGNPLPKDSEELIQIEFLLEAGLSKENRKASQLGKSKMIKKN